jgi:uncharacterized protein (TIGR02301 family)
MPIRPFAALFLFVGLSLSAPLRAQDHAQERVQDRVQERVPGRAQERAAERAQDHTQERTQEGPATAAPFDGDLQRLAEILGALHYLRNICGSNEGGKWRNEMQALIDAETPSGERRTRMIAAFNRGYNGFQQTYRSCTPAALVAIRRYIDEGSKIARDLTARYAN